MPPVFLHVGTVLLDRLYVLIRIRKLTTTLPASPQQTLNVADPPKPVLSGLINDCERAA